ncbi:MAG: NPCBM/NEW2 domain-containing protein [Planctomycetaceae bacterium]|nr:NPCBM/NEW2 domain-containing protein [Planctomycetaceae bacterium]
MLFATAVLACLNVPESITKADETPASATQFVLQDASGQTFQGPLNSLSSETITLGGPMAVSRLASQSVQLQMAPQPEPRPLSRTAVLLANGDQLQLRPASIQDGRLSAVWAAAPERPAVEIPLETIRAIVLDLPRDPGAAATLLSGLLDREHSADVLLLSNGDQLRGELDSLKDGKLTLGGAAGPAEVPLKGVRAVALSTELISFPPVTGRTALVSLDDGSWVTATSLQTIGEANTGKSLQIQAAFGATFTVPLSSLAGVRLQGGRAVPLSSLPVHKYVFTPFLSREWPLVTDRAVSGGFLAAGRRVFPRGLGMHSGARATWQLDGAYTAFEATVAIDDTAPAQASARVRVLIDGREAWASPELTAQAGPLHLPRIPLNGAKELTLTVDYGRSGDMGDRINWIDPVLIRQN